MPLKIFPHLSPIVEECLPSIAEFVATADGFFGAVKINSFVAVLSPKTWLGKKSNHRGSCVIA